MDPKTPTDRVRLRRRHDRGSHDSSTIYTILDEMPMCSVGYVFDGLPYVTPTLQWREGDHIYWHGSSASRMLRSIEKAQVCLTVAITDGFVMARSGFHHSTNYRSAMLFGVAHKVADASEKEARLRGMVESLFPGRWDSLRPVTEKELKATTVMSLTMDEASAKIRSGPPVDDEEDYAHAIWAGVIPVRMEVGAPVPDPRNMDGVAPSDHILNFKLSRDTG